MQLLPEQDANEILAALLNSKDLSRSQIQCFAASASAITLDGRRASGLQLDSSWLHRLTSPAFR